MRPMQLFVDALQKSRKKKNKHLTILDSLCMIYKLISVEAEIGSHGEVAELAEGARLEIV